MFTHDKVNFNLEMLFHTYIKHFKLEYENDIIT